MANCTSSTIGSGKLSSPFGLVQDLAPLSPSVALINQNYPQPSIITDTLLPSIYLSIHYVFLLLHGAKTEKLPSHTQHV
jgi:hypothetical protein